MLMNLFVGMSKGERSWGFNSVSEVRGELDAHGDVPDGAHSGMLTAESEQPYRLGPQLNSCR